MLKFLRFDGLNLFLNFPNWSSYVLSISSSKYMNFLATIALLMTLSTTSAAVIKKPEPAQLPKIKLGKTPIESMLLLDDILPQQSAISSLYKTTNGKEEDPLEPTGIEHDKQFSQIEESQRRLQYLYNSGFIGIESTQAPILRLSVKPTN